MNFYPGNYADARQSMTRLEDLREESDSKAHQIYGILNNVWGVDPEQKENIIGARTALVVDDGAMCRKACGAMMVEMVCIIMVTGWS